MTYPAPVLHSPFCSGPRTCSFALPPIPCAYHYAPPPPIPDFAGLYTMGPVSGRMPSYDTLLKRHLHRNERSRQHMARKRAQLKSLPPEEQRRAADRSKWHQARHRERRREQDGERRRVVDQAPDSPNPHRRHRHFFFTERSPHSVAVASSPSSSTTSSSADDANDL
uniref:Transcriptional activator HAP2 n=1 Tax=Mycena chlorophos TaxID=658473 RepID=A0ABQ0L5W3_MYCCL|nr:predicted protein [Mycena chlorophos]